MVQPHELQQEAGFIHAENFCHHALHGLGEITQTNAFDFAVLNHRFSDNTARIGEVNQPGIRA
ncbi:hypothetical protein D3C75_1348710 [compost metagenome]